MIMMAPRNHISILLEHRHELANGTKYLRLKISKNEKSGRDSGPF